MSVNKKKINDFMTERGGFAMIPNEIWEVKELDHIAKVIWCYIFSRNSTWDSSQNNIARNLGLHSNTVAKHVKTLGSLNMLLISKGPNNATNYELVAPAKWCAKIEAPLLGAHQMSPECEMVPYGEAHTQEDKKGKKAQTDKQTSSEEGKDKLDFEVDLNMDSYPTQPNEAKKEFNLVLPAGGEADQTECNKIHTPSERSPVQPTRIVAEPIPGSQIQPPLNSNSSAPMPTTPKQEITSDAILARWKQYLPSRVDYKDFGLHFGELFATLKRHSIPKDELSTKHILRSFCGTKPNPKAFPEWKLEKATQAIEEQREITYAPEFSIESATPEAPKVVKPGFMSRSEFDTDAGYALWHATWISGRDVQRLGGSVVEYYERHADIASIPTIKFSRKKDSE